MFYVPEKEEILELIIEMYKSGFTEAEITSILEMTEEERAFYETLNRNQEDWLRNQTGKTIMPKRGRRI